MHGPNTYKFVFIYEHMSFLSQGSKILHVWPHGKSTKFSSLLSPFIFRPSHNLNPLKTKRRLLYLKTQFVPRSKHFSSRL